MEIQKKNTFYRLCFWAIVCLLAFFLAVILIQMLGMPRKIGGPSYWEPVEIGGYVSNILIVLLILPTIYFLYRSFGLHYEKNRLLYFIGVGIVTLVVLIFQIKVVAEVYIYYQTDTMWMHIAAGSIVAGAPVPDNVLDYLAIHSQNVFLTFIFSLVMRIGYLFTDTNFYPLIIGQGVFVCIYLVIVAVLFDKFLHDKVVAFVFWFVLAIYGGLASMLTIPYTDGYSLPFIAGVVLLYFTMPKTCHMRYLRSVMIGFVGYLGYKIKAQAVIVLVAAFLWDFINFCNTKDKKLLLDWAAILIGLLNGVFFVKICEASTGMDLSFRPPLTLFHYFFMGQNVGTLGIYDYNDWIFSLQYGPRADLYEGFMRIFNMGFFGYIDFLTEKLTLVFTIPDFGFDSGWYIAYHPTPYYEMEGFNGLVINMIYVNGAYHEAYFAYEKFFWTFTVLLPIFSIPTALIYKKKEDIYFMTSAIGLILFVLLFEANFRYIFSYLFVFLFLGARGLEGVADRIFQKKRALPVVLA